jgi:hypothetical protein
LNLLTLTQLRCDHWAQDTVLIHGCAVRRHVLRSRGAASIPYSTHNLRRREVGVTALAPC